MDAVEHRVLGTPGRQVLAVHLRPGLSHVLLCWLALLVIRVAERATNTSWRRIALELGPVHEVTLERAAGTVTQTTELTGRQRDLLRACQVEPPARITHLDPA